MFLVMDMQGIKATPLQCPFENALRDEMEQPTVDGLDQ